MDNQNNQKMENQNKETGEIGKVELVHNSLPDGNRDSAEVIKRDIKVNGFNITFEDIK